MTRHAAARNAMPRVLAFHDLSPSPSRDVYRISPARFRELLRAVRGSACSITFDDGDRSQVELALPALAEEQVSGAIVFAVAGWVGRRAHSATWQQLRDVLAAGHSIGSHGDSHALLTGCSPSALHNEVYRSRALLEDKLGIAVESISMPGGRWSRRIAEACLDAGYRTLYTSEPHRIAQHTLRHGGRTLGIRGRLIVRRTMSPAMVAQYAYGGRIVTRRLQAEYALKTSLKRILTDAAYQKLWRSMLRSPVL